MATCGTCGQTVLFGGEKHGAQKFCNAKCLMRARLASAGDTIPMEEVRRHAHAIHHGKCPKCAGPGPVEVHISYRVWSVVFMTSSSSHPAISCSSCGRKSKLGSLLFSVLCGWWGFPWGLVYTPVQITRNLIGLRYKPALGQPSPALEQMARGDLAQGAMRP